MDDERKLHTTWPHGTQDIYLLEDDPKPANRIYMVQDDQDRQIPLLGSEIEDLAKWWRDEAKRGGQYDPPGGPPDNGGE